MKSYVSYKQSLSSTNTEINKTNGTAGSLDSYFFYLELILLVHVFSYLYDFSLSLTPKINS